MTPSNKPICISAPRLERSVRGWSQVSATVDGHDVFFASPDLELDANSETFFAAFLIPALHAGRSIQVDGLLSAGLIANASRIMQITEKWWGCKPITIHASGNETISPSASNDAGVFFSGGADSFHTLLTSGPLSALIFVHGFDLRLDVRYDAVMAIQEAEMRRIAASKGLKAILIRTSIRSHPLIESLDWTRSNGGVMGGLAHALRRELSAVRIASSCEREIENLTWGSHPYLEPLWGGGLIDVEHCGAEFRRYEKIQQIATDSDAQRSLRVCLRTLESGINCCHCEKCIRTMVMLARVGVLEKFPTFHPWDSVAAMIDSLPPLSPESLTFWADGFKDGLPPDINAAVKRLEDRSLRKHRREAGTIWKALRKVKRMLGG